MLLHHRADSLCCLKQVSHFFGTHVSEALHWPEGVSPFRAEQGTSLETPSRARASSCQAVGTTWFFSSYDGDLSLPLGLALGSPIFPSGCEGKLGVALESLQGLRDLT